jgi:hypothetical protein
VRVTSRNLTEVALWCGGSIGRLGDHWVVVLPHDYGTVHTGYFIVKWLDGSFEAFSPIDFSSKFELETLDDYFR